MKKIINIVLLLNIVLGAVFATGCNKVEAPQKNFLLRGSLSNQKQMADY